MGLISRPELRAFSVGLKNRLVHISFQGCLTTVFWIHQHLGISPKIANFCHFCIKIKHNKNQEKAVFDPGIVVRSTQTLVEKYNKQTQKTIFAWFFRFSMAQLLSCGSLVTMLPDLSVTL